MFGQLLQLFVFIVNLCCKINQVAITISERATMWPHKKLQVAIQMDKGVVTLAIHILLYSNKARLQF